jgi:D-lactate dehydrogenase (cytochrome)
VLVTDVCVPISRLAECITKTRDDLVRASFPATIVGHVGDGNFHVLCVLDRDNPAELEEATRLAEAMVRLAIGMGGTCTGEHGIGYGKMKHLREEHGAGVEVMQSIKLALDPDNRMNPGKILPMDGR